MNMVRTISSFVLDLDSAASRHNLEFSTPFLARVANIRLVFKLVHQVYKTHPLGATGTRIHIQSAIAPQIMLNF
jgi:hypothetical protein